MKLTVQLVTWNGVKYVPYLFDSLRKQTFTDWKLLILDNGSTDGMVGAMKKELTDFPVDCELIEHVENIGFSGGHNELFKQCDTEYVMIINQDLYLNADCLERLVACTDIHPNVAAVGPRLMQWHFDYMITHMKNMDGDVADIYSDVVDSLGMKVFRSRRVVEIEQMSLWNKVSTRYSMAELLVFGISGACAMYRVEALRAVAFLDGSIFDPDYFMYKEDVDLAYRLRSAGYGADTVVDAVVYHDRSTAGAEHLSDRAAAENKKKQTAVAKFHSYKNHLVTLYKNEYWQNVLLDFPWIVWYEGKKFVWFLLFDREVLKGLGDVLKLRKELKKKRIEIKNKRNVSWKEMRKWV